jgi:hypothetical protein
MRNAELVERLHTLAGDAGPGPDPAFVARLGSELHQLDQVPILEQRRPRVHHRGLGGMPWLRMLALAVPVGAVALAGAFVALRPAPAHPRQVRTADNPGVSTPAPDVDQPTAGERDTPAAPTAGEQTGPAADGDRHAAIGTGAAQATTTTTVEPTRHLVVPAPNDQSPQTTVVPRTRSPEPTTSTTAPTTTTMAPASLSLHCAAGTDGGSLAVTCTWSATTSSAFKSYRLSREQPGTNRVVVFSTDNRTTTTYADHDVQPGASYYYLIEALDASGNVIARGVTSLSCC